MEKRMELKHSFFVAGNDVGTQFYYSVIKFENTYSVVRFVENVQGHTAS